MFVYEAHERVSSPHDYSHEYILYINPSKSKLKHLVKNRIAVRGLVLDDSRTFIVADAAECDHDMMRHNLVFDLGYKETIVDESTELFVTDINSKEGSYYTDSISISDMNVYYRGIDMGGKPLSDLIRSNTGLHAGLGQMNESEKKAFVHLIMEEELMEASLGNRITAIAASLGLLMSSMVAPLRVVTRSPSVAAVEAVDAPIVIDPATFERWMTTQSHDEKEYESMNPDAYDVEALIQTDDFIYLSLTIWGEARSTGEIGMRAVGHVIVNRANIGVQMYGGETIRGVATKDRQFSCWNDDDPNRDKMLNIDSIIPESPDGVAWKVAQAVAVQILTGRSEDPTNGATMYHTARINPYWADDERTEEVSRIAGHVFYIDTKWT